MLVVKVIVPDVRNTCALGCWMGWRFTIVTFRIFTREAKDHTMSQLVNALLFQHHLQGNHLWIEIRKVQTKLRMNEHDDEISSIRKQKDK